MKAHIALILFCSILLSFSSSAQNELMKKLSDAIISKDHAGVKQAIADGADVDGMTEHNQPPLVVAIAYMNPEALQILLDNKASLEKVQLDPIALGASKKHMEIIKILLKAGLNVKNENKPAVLTALSSGAHLDVIKMLVEAGADPEAKNAFDQNGITLLSGIMSPQKRMQGIKTAIEDSKTKGTKILPYYHNAEEADFSNPVEIAKYLESKGVDPTAKSAVGNPLYFCASLGTPEFAQYLISKGIDLDPSGISPLWNAIHYKNTEIAKVIINAKPDLERLHFYPAGDYAWKLSYLCEAVLNGDVETAKALIDAGVNINETFERIENETTTSTATQILTTTEYTIHTALSLAAEVGKDEMVQYLKSRGGKGPTEL